MAAWQTPQRNEAAGNTVCPDCVSKNRRRALMNERDDSNVIDMRCHPVNEPEPQRLTTHPWWWWLASGIFLANFLPLEPQVTHAAQVIAGAAVILPAALSLVRRWNAKAGGTPA
jgi:hypothetical protein